MINTTTYEKKIAEGLNNGMTIENIATLMNDEEIYEMTSWLEGEMNYCYDHLDEEEKHRYIVLDYICECCVEKIINDCFIDRDMYNVARVCF